MFGSSAAKRASQKARAAKSKARRSLRQLACEPLEKREVLSASGFAQSLPQLKFDIAIRGTDIQFSPLGLPSSMGGDLYGANGSAADGQKIGHYQENLQPILMDINGDQVPDFVGTTGVATFEFFVGNPGKQFSLGTITTVNTSFIQGVTAAGEMVVGSQGTITAGTAMLSRLTGGFVSQSTVGLFPTFTMATTVHFSVTASLQGALVAAVATDDHVATRGGHDAPGPRCDEPHHATNAPHHAVHNDDDHRRDGDRRHERSVDKAFEKDVDWCSEALDARGRGRKA